MKAIKAFSRNHQYYLKDDENYQSMALKACVYHVRIPVRKLLLEELNGFD